MAQASTVDQPLRLPLVFNPANRDTTTAKDARLVNCFVEHTEMDEYWVYKRPGLTASVTKTGNGIGSYNWQGHIYTIFGTTIYKDGTGIGTVDATNGVYRFSSTLGGTPRLTLGNGVKAYAYDNTTFAQITDAAFPSTFYKGWSYLDGTMYAMTSPAAIQGSLTLNNPTTWDPLNLINAQIEPDNGVALSKQLVYTIALKQWTTEVFYDAGNPTGSPLGPVQGARIPYGCASADSVREIDDMLIWASMTRQGEPNVVVLDKLVAKEVATPAVSKLLKNADFTTVYSWTLKMSGHKFYVLTIKNTNITIAYDLTDKMWSQWTDPSGNYLPIVDATVNASNQHLVQHETNGILYRMDMSFTNDGGTVFPVDLYTPNFDGGSRKRKHMKMMYFIADQTPGSILKVRSSDDDYKSWSNFRSVDLGTARPFLDDCGTFHRRAHHFHHNSNTTLRLQAVDLQMDLGTL
jgi:hypothetical protein